MKFMRHPVNFLSILAVSIFFGTLCRAAEPALKMRVLSVNNGLSQYDVSAVCQDNYGFVWIATYDGLNCYDGIVNTIYRHEPDDEHSISYNRVQCLCFDPIGNNMWIGTQGGGVNLFDYATDSFRRIYLVEDHNPLLPENVILGMVCTSDDKMWIATPNNLFLVDTDVIQDTWRFNIIQTFPLYNAPWVKMCMSDRTLYVIMPQRALVIGKSGDSYAPKSAPSLERLHINDIYKDRDGRIWIATSEGMLYSRSRGNGGGQSPEFIKAPLSRFGETGDVDAFLSVTQDHKGYFYAVAKDIGLIEWADGLEQQATLVKLGNTFFMTHNVRQLMVDYSNTLWAASQNAGLGIIDLQQNEINHLGLGDLEDGNPVLITNLAVEGERLWVGTQRRGVILYDLAVGKTIGRYKIFPNMVHPSISYISHRDSGGMWVLSGRKIMTVSAKRGKVELDELKSFSMRPDSLRIIDFPISICEDDYGNIWVGLRNGIINIREKEGETHYTVLHHEFQNQIKVIKDPFCNRIWVCYNRNGIMRIELDSEGNITDTYRYEHRVGDRNSLSSNVVWCLTRTRDGRIFAGTDVGLNEIDPSTNRVTRFNAIDKVRNYKIMAVTEDSKGQLWLNTSQGLLCFSIDSLEVTEYNHTDGLSSNSMTEASTITPDDVLYVGGNEGISYFDTANRLGNTIEPKVVISDMRLAGKKVIPGKKYDGHIVLTRSILDTERIVLRHFQNSFSLEFASLSFNNPLKNRYRYRLTGYDKEWINTDAHHRAAVYSNLPPGSYTFELYASNNDGVFSERERSINITIRRLFWASWAWPLYIALAAGLGLVIYRFFHNQHELRRKLFVEQVGNHAQKVVNESKLRAYVNITHELRTPLSLIMAPLEELVRDESIAGRARMLLGTMRRNSDRMMELINKFLILCRIDTHSLPLSVSMTDWVKMLEYIKERFDVLARQKQIEFTFVHPKNPMPGMADREKITSIVTNILSNAFKFTSEGGCITLIIEERGENYVITVEDNGIGILNEHLGHVFDRFYQVDNERGAGTGIGLELVKHLAELHLGQVSIESTPGEGTTVRVEIPYKEESYLAVEPDITSGLYLPDEDLSPAESQSADDIRPIVLVVEDDEDMCDYIVPLLAAKYDVRVAGNGEQGLEIALQCIPDLVITDVMMPGMSGIELCRNIKDDFRTSHVPVIMLSAKQDETEGLESGALDYIMKPFSPHSLLLKVQNLLAFRRENKMGTAQEESISQRIDRFREEKERSFLEKTYGIVEKNLSNSDFSVDDLIREFGTSRAQMHRKMTALTGRSASAFIRNIRLDKAREMLETGRYSITEVLYTVGYNSPSYFSKTYKERFGILPSELLQK